jgi:hypothetical protein
MTAENIELKELMAGLNDFRPFAYFDKHMDCIRVLIRDVSVTEERLGKFFTIAKPNHMPAPFSGGHVGFTIKGVAHLFHSVGLPLSGVHQLADLLDAIVQRIPHAAVKQIVEEFSPVLKEKNLSVTFEEEEEALAA